MNTGEGRSVSSFVVVTSHYDRKVLLKYNDVETCVILVRESICDDDMISIKVNLEGIALDQGRYVLPAKPTYKNIKQWILDKYGFNVSTLYIAQIKNKVGLEKRKNYNPDSGEGKVPVCPPEKGRGNHGSLTAFFV